MNPGAPLTKTRAPGGWTATVCRLANSIAVRLTDAQICVLAALYTAPGPARQKDLQLVIGAAVGSLSYRLDALSARGLARQDTDEQGQPMHGGRWSITYAGRRVVQALAGATGGPS